MIFWPIFSFNWQSLFPAIIKSSGQHPQIGKMMKCFAVELQTNQYFGNKLVVDKVKCECQLLGTVCRVRLMQTFINKGQTPIQTAYISCLRNDISICGFSFYNATTNRHISSKAVEKNTFDRGNASTFYLKLCIQLIMKRINVDKFSY